MAKSLFGKGGAVRVEVDPEGVSQLLQANKEIRDLLMSTARNVADEAASTASAAEKGPGGKLDGYAAAGFSIKWESRGGKRPRVLIISNADPLLATRVHIYTTIANGVGHLRAALYKFTQRG